MGGELLSAAWTAGITIVIVFASIVGIGFWFLARRKKLRPAPDALAALQQKANILLVRVDDAVKNADDELAFAVAQFGDIKSQEFDDALTVAKENLREAFSLQQKLDDAYVDSDTERRTWSSRIIHLCETTRTSLEAHEQAFASLRELEKNAPQNLLTVRTALDGIASRMVSASETLKDLRSRYNERAISSIADNIDRAKKEHSDAERDVKSAQNVLDDTAGTGAETAADIIHSAGEHTYRAQKFLDAIDSLHDELTKTRDALFSLRDSTNESLSLARSVRDAPPNPDTGAAIGRAIQVVEAALNTDLEGKDPLATLETLRAANAELDSSLAGARNQKQRLDGARTALVGALVGARSQLQATKNYIDNRRGGVGTEARTRLAEAERLLKVAEAESDPVVALDTARSSATYSRDADALARYDLLAR